MDKGFPIPFGRVDNLRSFVGLDNLVDFIDCCVEHPLAANQTFVISDGRDLSTPDLIRLVANTLGKNPRLVNVPVSLMHGLAACLGKAAVADRLFGSLQVDTRKNHELLGWVPAFTMEDLLVPTIQYYRTSKLSN
ncbi:MAG: hypothetical protein EOO39_41480 [Cytophagaceae bacterium]|nr:MAG: hypothetical protein EOO39_41480 [Cytophagaceae bacterium]